MATQATSEPELHAHAHAASALHSLASSAHQPHQAHPHVLGTTAQGVPGEHVELQHPTVLTEDGHQGMGGCRNTQGALWRCCSAVAAPIVTQDGQQVQQMPMEQMGIDQGPLANQPSWMVSFWTNALNVPTDNVVRPLIVQNLDPASCVPDPAPASP